MAEEGKRVLVLGMDVSTAVTAATLLATGLGVGHRIVSMSHVELSKVDGFWAKVDALQAFLEGVKDTADRTGGLTHAFVEESLQAFRPGLSSAATLMTLAKFNGITCAMVRSLTGCTPEPLAATSARKSCGIVVRRDAVDDSGKRLDAKRQTFRQLTAQGGPLAHVEFPTKRGGDVKDWAMDEADSFVVALAGLRTLEAQ